MTHATGSLCTLKPLGARNSHLQPTLTRIYPVLPLRRNLGVLTLEQALARHLKASQMHYAEIMLILRQLIYRVERRQDAWPHFQTALRLLDGFSDVLRATWNHRGPFAFPNCALAPSTITSSPVAI